MAEQPRVESIKVEGSRVLERLKDLVHEGNVRHIIIRRDGQTVAEFPLTVGVVAAVFAPILAAAGTVVALTTGNTIELHRVETPPAGESS